MIKCSGLFCLFVVLFSGAAVAQTQPRPPAVIATKAGSLIAPKPGTPASNHVTLIEGDKIPAVGPNLAVPAGATVIDLSSLTVLPGLVDAHTHMAITYKEQ